MARYRIRIECLDGGETLGVRVSALKGKAFGEAAAAIPVPCSLYPVPY